MNSVKKPVAKLRSAPAKPVAAPEAKRVTRRASKPGVVRAAPKAMTLRLKPSLQEGLAVLHEAVKRPVNKLVNEAVEEFLDRQTETIERDLEGLLSRIKAVRKKDPKFSTAIQEFAEAESRYSRADPVEGTVVIEQLGPSQRAVRSLLSRK